jgi:hypothetical protein
MRLKKIQQEPRKYKCIQESHNKSCCHIQKESWKRLPGIYFFNEKLVKIIGWNNHRYDQ